MYFYDMYSMTVFKTVSPDVGTLGQITIWRAYLHVLWLC